MGFRGGGGICEILGQIVGDFVWIFLKTKSPWPGDPEKVKKYFWMESQV